MNILILHRIPYQYMRYDDALDHTTHNIYYIGEETKLTNIPPELKCTKLSRAGKSPVYEEVIECISALDIKFDRVISMSEYELMDAAKVREHLGVAGPTLAQVEKVRNKAVMKRHIKSANIAAPSFMMLNEWVQGENLNIPLDRNIILKPIDGASSVNVIRFPDQTALRNSLKNKSTGVTELDQATPRYDTFEIEEFIDGDILHFDGIVYQGDIKIITGGRYINTLLDFANGKPSGSVQIDINDKIVAWVKSTLQALDIHYGAFHLEAIDNVNGLVFLEIANRSGGARIVETFKLQTGVHLPSIELKIFMQPATFKLDTHIDPTHKYGWFIVPGHKLKKKYCHVTGHEFLKDKQEVLSLNELPGDVEVKSYINYMEHELPLAGLLKSDSADKLIAMMKQLFNQLIITDYDEPYRAKA